MLSSSYTLRNSSLTNVFVITPLTWNIQDLLYHASTLPTLHSLIKKKDDSLLSIWVGGLKNHGFILIWILVKKHKIIDNVFIFFRTWKELMVENSSYFGHC